MQDSRPLRVLHLHSSFSAGGKELRAARLMNAFGPKVLHTVVSAQPGAYGAAIAVDPSLSVTYPEDFPSLQGRPLPRRLLGIARALRDHDLVLTYNWGAMDAVLAHALFRRSLGLPPLVHHEDGFNEDEANRLKPARNWFRRVALTGASAVIVPSQRLEAIALDAWKQPRGKVRLIINGINCAAYVDKPRPDILPGLVKQPGEKWVGTLAGLRPVKNLPRLVRAFAQMPQDWRLVTVPAEARVDLKALPGAIGCKRVSFGKADDMERLIGIAPGSVTPLAMINAAPGSVICVIEAGLAAASRINVHPLRNTATLGLSGADVLRLIGHWGHAPRVAEIPVQESA